MTFSDTEMMELGITQPNNIHNTRSLIRALKYVLDILQTEEAFTMEEYKHTHTHTHTHARARKDSINMDDEGVMIFLRYILLKRRFHKKAERKVRKKRSFWVTQIYRQMEESDIFHTLVQEMALVQESPILSEFFYDGFSDVD